MRCALAFILLWLAAPLLRAAEHHSDTGRILRNIDFEERRLGNPEETPMHWSKVEGPGIPHYVNGRLAMDRFRSGNYSFRFDLNGGSLAYRYDVGQITVQPQAHYRVQTYVQTTPLPHARARLTAYFADAAHIPIASSTRRSELFATRELAEGWHPLSVELSAGPSAHSLVIELELLQPAQYDQGRLGEQNLFPQDIRGSAWFDDVTVSQVPKVTMSTLRPGNIFRRSDPVTLRVDVNDRSTDDLAAQLVVVDAEGKTVFQRTGALDMAAAQTLGPGHKAMVLLLPALSPGWYEAGLVMTSRGRYIGRHTLHLVLLADDAPPPAPRWALWHRRHRSPLRRLVRTARHPLPSLRRSGQARCLEQAWRCATGRPRRL